MNSSSLSATVTTVKTDKSELLRDCLEGLIGPYNLVICPKQMLLVDILLQSYAKMSLDKCHRVCYTEFTILCQHRKKEDSIMSNRYNSDYLSPWGYIGFAILWSIPVIGWIIWLVNCFSSGENLRNYARSIFCGFILSLIVAVVVVVLVYAGVVSLDGILNNIPIA